MPELDNKSILRDIRNKVLYPLYFLMGEETYFIDVIANELEDNVLTESEKEFNLSILYGKDTDVSTIISTAKRYPMMASHNLVIIREAHHIKDIDGFLPYITNPLDSTILVICYKYKKIDKRSKLFKSMNKAGVIFHGRKLYDNQVPGWIAAYVKQNGYNISPPAMQMLADHLGSDLGKIVNELKKLFINLKKGSEIDKRAIEENIGISKDYNIFEFQNALGARDSKRAFRVAKYFADNPKSNPFVMTTGVLYQFFSKVLLYHSLKDKKQQSAASELGIHPFFVKDYEMAAKNYKPEKILRIFSEMRDYDLRSKGLGNETTGSGELLRELTYKILN